MQTSQDHYDLTKQLSIDHYENFPVASIILPKHLRFPIALIYKFARQADDFADEGNLKIEDRLKLLDQYIDELELLKAYIKPSSDFFVTLGKMIHSYQLPYDPFFDLLDAFKQDVIKTRYDNFNELLDYCKRSANPIGRLLLHLYQSSTQSNIHHSDQICTALQLINFYQDIAIDFNKNEGKRRIYLCQDELASYGISVSHIQSYVDGTEKIDSKWIDFMQFNLQRAKGLLSDGKPLGIILKGRIGFEMRMIIAGGDKIIDKIVKVNGDVFNKRPTLNALDWCVIFLKALFKG